MDIHWFGQSFFEITTDTEKQKGVKIYFDPYGNHIGLKPPQDLSATVVMISHQHPDHNNIQLFKDPGIVLDTAGEYSVRGIDIKGILTFHDVSKGQERGTNLVFIMESEGIRLAHLGDLGHLLDESQMGEIGVVDILLIPVGGNHSINGKEATKIIKQLEPKIIIPMHYKIPGIQAELDGIEEFCKEMGICLSQALKKLSVKAASLTGKEMEVVLMEKS